MSVSCYIYFVFFSSRRRHTRCALVTGVQTCALPILHAGVVRFKGGKPLDDARVQDAIAAAEAELNGTGRLVIRPSGTEPVIRVMAEGDDSAQVEAVVNRICAAVEQAAA